LALRVVEAGERVVMPLAAVDLDDQAQRGPAQVGVDGAGRQAVGLVALGPLETRPNDQVEDAVLERASRRLGAEIEDASRQPLEVAGGELRGAERALGGALVGNPRDVDDRAELRRHRDALDDDPLDVPAAVRLDAWVMVLGRSRDVERPAVPLDEVVECGRGVVREDGSVAAGLDSREPAAFERDVVVANSVNTAVKGVEVPSPHANPDRDLVEAACAKLVKRQHAPLPSRELRHRDVGLRGRWVSLRLTF
jgi:hypothetical protein